VKKITGQEKREKEVEEVAEDQEDQEAELEVEPHQVHQREEEVNSNLTQMSKNSHLYERVYFKSTFER